MPEPENNEKRFEADIEAALLSPAGGYVKGTHACDPKLGLYAAAPILLWPRDSTKAARCPG